MGAVTKNLRDGEITIRDGTTPTANEVILALEEGDLSFEEVNNVNNVSDRGNLSHMRYGDEEPVKLSFTLKFTEFLSQGANSITAYEGFHKIGAAAGWVTTNDDCGGVFTLDADFKIYTPCDTEEDELIKLIKVHGAWTFTEGDEYNTLAFDGEAFMTRPNISKVSQS